MPWLLLSACNTAAPLGKGAALKVSATEAAQQHLRKPCSASTRALAENWIVRRVRLHQVNMSIHMFILMSIHMDLEMSIHTSIDTPVHISIYMSIHVSVYAHMCPCPRHTNMARSVDCQMTCVYVWMGTLVDKCTSLCIGMPMDTCVNTVACAH